MTDTKTGIKAALDIDLKPETLAALLEDWATARLAALDAAAKAEDPKAAAMILAELLGGAQAALEAEGVALEGWASGLAGELAGLAGENRTILEGFGALGIEGKSVSLGIEALMIGGAYPIDNTFWETGGAQATAKPAPPKPVDTNPPFSDKDLDHAIDPVSGRPYFIQTRPETDHEILIDPMSGYDYEVILDTSGGARPGEPAPAPSATPLEDDPEYQAEMETVLNPGGKTKLFPPAEGEEGYEYKDPETGEVYEIGKAQFEVLTGVDTDGGEEDDGFGDPEPEDEPADAPADEPADEPEAPEEETDDEDMIPAEDKGAPMKPVEPGDSTDGTTQPDPTGERGASPLPAPDGLAPLILTDPERDAIVFNFAPKEPGWGLTQPSPVDQGGGRPPLPAPDGGNVMGFDAGFDANFGGPGDFLF